MTTFIDVETSSNIDLRKAGLYRYATDKSTKLNCLVYAIDDAETVTLTYEQCNGPGFKEWLQQLIDTYDRIVAHNAEFEKAVLEAVVGVKIPNEKLYDTMIAAGYYGYPRGLDDAAKALQCPILKDVEGGRVMKDLAKGKHTPAEKPAEFQRLYQYCGTDVLAMREVFRKLPEPPEMIQTYWQMSLRINGRGVPIDVQAIANAVSMKRELAIEADLKMAALTSGQVSAVTQVPSLLQWVRTNGVPITDCTKDTVIKVLDGGKFGPVPPLVREVLELRQRAGLTSLSKYEKMQLQRVGDRLYGMFDFYGAHTGRWSGGGPQLQNLPRADHPEILAATLASSPALFRRVYIDVQKALKNGLRGVLKARPGYTFLGTDLSQIEARATAWLAGEQRLLDMFASGQDVYCMYASQVFGETITPEMCKAEYSYYLKRLTCKAMVLGFGFAGGIGAIQQVSENYGLNLLEMAAIILPTATPAELTEGQRSYEYYTKKCKQSGIEALPHDSGVASDIVKQRYRRDFPAIVHYWDVLEQVFRTGGQAGMVNIKVHGSGLRTLTLPSRRQIYYQGVRARENGGMSFQGRNKRETIWKGLLMENCAQAVNADVSMHYMLKADQQIAPIVHHCHDEFTMELPTNAVGPSIVLLQHVMDTLPAWATGLPIASDTWTGERYGK